MNDMIVGEMIKTVSIWAEKVWSDEYYLLPIGPVIGFSVLMEFGWPIMANAWSVCFHDGTLVTGFNYVAQCKTWIYFIS